MRKLVLGVAALGLLVLPGSLAIPTTAAAGDHWSWKRGPSVCVPPSCPGQCCPDYLGKPWPCLPCATPQCLCDDYCAKPFPCFFPVQSCLCDDYCRKPLVCLPGIPCFPWYKCSAPAECLPPAK